MSGAPVPGVVNVYQGITPGGSPQALSVKALRNTEKKRKKKFLGKCFHCVKADHMLPDCRAPTCRVGLAERKGMPNWHAQEPAPTTQRPKSSVTAPKS